MMNESKENHGISRFLVAVLAGMVAVLGVWGGYTYWKNVQYRRGLEQGYRMAVQEAATNLSNISTDLVKGLYAGSPAQLSQISAKLWKEASSAKSALSVLPVAELHLDKTHQFLSQVGDYALYLSRKTSNGETLTMEERDNFLRLREYAERLSEAVDKLDNQLDSGEITFAEIEKLVAEGMDADYIDDEMPALVTNSSLDAVEGGFSGYPTLIYDGPFSDHILDKTPILNKTVAAIDMDDARRIALSFAGGKNIEYNREENSALPCYVFYSDECSIAVTKHGGKLCYLICPKGEGDYALNLSPQQAIAEAQSFLKKQGLNAMTETYYEIDDGIMTINFAYEQKGVRCYTDLIKVSVSMENGDIVSYDARGYWVNHQERSFAEPALSMEQARELLSPQLTVESSRLAMIPTSGENEALCWEFACQGSAGDHVMVYVNAATGAEQEILLLIEDEDGVLTK